jgi:gamma-glutamyltranspeptidase/glutathione hydrolase
MIDPTMLSRCTMTNARGRALLHAPRRIPLLAALLGFMLAAVGGALGQTPNPAPDGLPQILPRWARPAGPAIAKSDMIAAANPLAVDAGLEILRAGGSAADAAVTVQLVLNLVEPQSSGIGGGAFALHWQAAPGRLQSYDGRETAPAAARPDRFLVNGKPLRLSEAIPGGSSVGVPGTLRLLEALHKEHGKLPWARLVAPAIRLAEQGFPVSPRLHMLLRWYGAERLAPGARDYFFDRAGSARPIGYLLKNPEFATTLRAIAEGGAGAFYEGPVAQAIVEAVQRAPNRHGDLTLADLAQYRVKEREPVCFAYRRNRVCGMGPPSSGGLAVGQVLKLVEGFDLGRGPADALNGRALHLIAEAQRLAFADRNRYVGDPDFVPVPPSLLDQAYLDRRRALINPQAAMAKATPGTPPRLTLAPGVDDTAEQDGTTHFSIVDRDGNIVSMTSTIEAGFGSRLWAAGFLLNNELTDFALSPVDRAGRPLANAVGPGKRPRSSMAPTIVFDAEGKPWAVLGSPGGSRIIIYVVKMLVALIDWKLDAQAAAALMNFGSRGAAFEIEADQGSALWHALAVRPYGHRIMADYLESGAHVIVRRADDRLEGGADPRREGVARGD